MRITLLATFLCVATSCGVEPEPVASTSEAVGVPHEIVRSALLAEDSILTASIATFGEADGLWPWMTDDVLYLHPGVNVIASRSEARAFLRTTYPDPAARKMTLHRETGDVSADGRLGYTFGWFDVAVSATASTEYGKYIATWRRDGAAWRIAGFVRIRAAAAPAAPPADALIFAGDHGTPGPGNAAADAIAADTAFAALSVALGYTVAFTTYGDDAAVITSPGDYFWNAAGVAIAWAGWTPAEQLAWGPIAGQGAASGDLAFTVGTATYTLDDGTTHFVGYSKYLTVWVHQPDGSWRFLLDGGNARPAP